MGTHGPSRVFVGRLAGADVFDPIGDRVGKVSDVVVVFRLRGAPLAVGLTVDVVGKRRVFVPLTRVTSMANGQVITTGLVNMRRFNQRPVETMAVGELLDRQVTIIESGELAEVEDLAIEQTRAREWRVTTLYVRMGRGAKDAGNTLLIPTSAVRGLATKVSNQGATALLAQISGLKAPDVADILRDLPEDRLLAVARELSDERLADVLEELGDDDRVAIMESLDVERAADVLEVMQPDDAADLVNELPVAQAEALLERMEPEDARDVRRLMSYSERSAGGLMTTDPIILPPDASVAMALAQARRPELPPALASIIFVTRPPHESPTGRYIGVVHLQRALREPPSNMIGGIVEQVENLSPDDGIGTITRLLATYNLTALPVLADDMLVGAVSVDDVLDHLLPDDWREADEIELDEAVDAQHNHDDEEVDA
ncbi:magnesium transporter [Arcanobacterium haemolyticum]|uniref:MgtE intracellular region n=1 Tax=Arcanobacterium haemolyticum (strain ATCC 9345 / DSM 20595 / CCM 5947 / CCUG 17215 / LMG 16163 / NBRC 15585 / NCTC 8452 / 11018) TaxID=644284 RepID=D7BJW3_ARCHD|nr:CBS domain-containing protein [Arcanobacterium haemolyticum]ADH92943.1 MgtE intracellular region [Arcanobacterium haemolyticum DSM 20595]QCX47021.1 magnesium transporter [Arcanobacterium haemolyticum]SPT75601.1 Magnesium transporter mgtE [Arcanobacterium haemolyticum]SQH28301.1 Magnesium transporter mgtE [Arcanobacterium haemolyticum]